METFGCHGELKRHVLLCSQDHGRASQRVRVVRVVPGDVENNVGQRPALCLSAVGESLVFGITLF
jgi:hypothetical protein